MKKLLFVFVLGFVVASNAFCQTDNNLLPTYNPPSPEAAALGKYVEHPVSTFTGTPKIEIPLFEIKTGRITVPISLSYHGSGIKIDEIASRVGMGWVLNAGGIVTRTVKDSPDEFNYRDYKGYFQTLGIPPIDPASEYDPVTGRVTYHDLQPDTHYYNFGSKQGTIYFTSSAQPHVTNMDPLKVVGPYSGTNQFVITTEDGLIYTFAATEDGDHWDGSDYYTYTASWYLTKIEDPVTGKSVTLQYRTDIPEFINYSFRNMYQSYGCDGISSTVSQFAAESHVINPKVLQKIIYDDGYIEFKADESRQDQTGDKAYTEINQYDQFGNLKKGYDLKYHYTSNGTATENKRLYLDTLKQKGIEPFSYAQKFLPPYIFTYKNRDLLPERNSAQQDIWGYYNANGASLVDANDYPGEGILDFAKIYVHSNGNKKDYLPFDNPSSPATTVIPGVERSSNAATVDYGTLNKIVYPTKGYTTYSYQINQFDGLYSGGGIRIAEIDDFSADNHLLLSKTYSYQNGFLGGAYPQVGYPVDDAGVNKVVRLSQNAAILGMNQGNYVGYEQVSETQTGLSGPNNGTIVRHYSSDKDVAGPGVSFHYNTSCAVELSQALSSTYYPFFEMTSNEAKRGLLLEEDDYDTSNQLLKSLKYTYGSTSTTIAAIHSRLVIFSSNPNPQNSPDITEYIDGQHYLNSEKMLLADKAETTYKNGRALKDSIHYYYTPDELFPAGETDYGRGSGGDQHTITYTYPSTYHTDLMEQMVAMHYLNPVIKQDEYILHGDSMYYVSDKINNYQHNPYYADTVNQNSIILKEIYTLKAPVVRAAGSSITIGDPANPGSLFEKRVTYNAYDAYANVLSVSKVGGPDISYIYGDEGKRLYAQVSNVSYPAIVSALGGQTSVNYFRDFVRPSFENTSTYLAPLRSIPHAQVTTYNYDFWMNLSDITDPRNEITSYTYDDFQRLIQMDKSSYGTITRYCYNYAGETGCVVPPQSYNDPAPIPPTTPDPPPPPPIVSPTGIYARVEITNIQNETGETYNYQTADVCVKFYADNAATIPLTLTSDLPFQLSTPMDVRVDGVTVETDPYSATHYAITGDNSYCLGTEDLDDYSEDLDENGNVVHYYDDVFTYNLVPSDQFAILPTYEE